MKTAVVILNWNTREYLEKFLPALISSVQGMDAEVIVSDSASTDGSLEMLAEKYPSVRRIPLDANYGFTGGYNRAFQALENSDAVPEYFVLINSDIEVSDGWLQPLAEYMDSHPECGACGPKLHSWQEKEKFEYAGAAGGLLDSLGYPLCRGRVLKRTETDRGQYDGAPADVLWVTGACLMVRSSVWQSLGGLDDRFFAHMEEIDLCWRMQLEGWKVSVIPSSTVWHLGGGTLPSNSPWKVQLNFRNNRLMLEKNLAKTLSLKLLHQLNGDCSKAAAKGCRKAARIICFRSFLDFCSSAVWFLTGHADWAKAVGKARKEALALSARLPAEEVAGYLEQNSEAKVYGLYKGWILPQAMLKGESVFEIVRKTYENCH